MTLVDRGEGGGVDVCVVKGSWEEREEQISLTSSPELAIGAEEINLS